MNSVDRIAERLLSSALLWGGLFSFVFHTVLDRVSGMLPPWLVERLTGRWESYACTTLFFIALAFVVIRCIGLAPQFWACQAFRGDNAAAKGQQPKSLAASLVPLEKVVGAKRSLLYQRLSDAQQFCARQGAGPLLATHLKELADADFDRRQAEYGLLRLLTWAIPSCGSVATIRAIAGVVERLPSDSSGDVLSTAASGLSGAFNLFAFTVGLSIVLVVLKYALEEAEQLVLAMIEREVSLVAAAQTSGSTATPNLPTDQFQQLTELLKSVATSLAQQSAAGSKVATAAPLGSAPIKEIEGVVQAAIATALKQQPAMGMASEPTAMDSAGWKALQQVLHKLANVLEQQNAKLETEGRVSKHLTTILDEGLKGAPNLRIHDGKQAA